MGDTIRIKPHHFIDIVSAFGRGQRTFEAHPYGHAVHTVSERLLDDRDAMLEMDLGADDICEPCKHNVDGLCDDTIDTSFRPDAPSSKREYNLLIDQRWCERLGLAQGDRLGAREFCERLGETLRARDWDMTDIYCELPAERVAERVPHLRAGIDLFLKNESQGRPG